MRILSVNLSVILIFCATMVSAQDGFRESDRVYDRDELTEMLAGHAVEFFDGGVSRYRADGAYSYKYNENDRPFLGSWAVPEPGFICVSYENGDQRCDVYVDDGKRMVMIIENGTRFPVRDRRALIDGY